MSNLLNQAQNPSANFRTSPSGSISKTSMPQPLTLAGKGGNLGLGKTSHYSQLSAMQQHHQQLQTSVHVSTAGGIAATANTQMGAGGLVFRPSMDGGIGITVPKAQITGTLHNGITNAGGSVTMIAGSGAALTQAQGHIIPAVHQEEEEEGETINLANTKEKTPMCLINELARYNKVSHQYTLVDEQGPAHKKTFYVKLKLGEEEYSASGESIKKAQHAAAAIALDSTAFPHPVPKQPRFLETSLSNVTPTVELNALAMKRGEPAVYKLIEPRNQQPIYPHPNIDFRGMYNQRYHYGKPPRPFYVSLIVGQREFIGDGPTRQAARHCAASKALRILKNLPVSNEVKLKTESEESPEDLMKSEISLVHEIALKRNLPVNFEVTRESGPPHMKTFVTRCVVGEMIAEAEGNSKKISKKRAAELMLAELRKLPLLSACSLKPKPKTPVNKKKNRNIIKVQKADPSYGVGINPISRLIQIMQAQKKKEPLYTLIAEKGLPRKREFIMQVQIDEHVATGVGPNKKLAKRNAAESMLQLLGFSRPSPQPVKPAIKTSHSSEGSTSDKKVTFVDSGKAYGNGVSESQTTTGCQLVPGLLRINPGVTGMAAIAGATGLISGTSANLPFSVGQTENLASVLANAGPRAEQQLNDLASRLGLTVTFEEFTKKNNTEFLTRVTLSTEPPQVHLGTGPNLEASRDAAALSAIRTMLAITTNTTSTIPADVRASGDGLAVKSEPGSTSSTLTLLQRKNSAGD